VVEVTPGGNGWKAGLRQDDVITAYNEVSIRDMAALRAATGSAPKDVPVRITVERGDATLVLTAAPGALGIQGAAHRRRP
jgi:S1-C subfamily serine protease